MSYCTDLDQPVLNVFIHTYAVHTGCELSEQNSTELISSTFNPLYTDTRYNTFRYNDKLTDTKLLLKR